MADKSKLLEDVKLNLRSVLVSMPKGCKQSNIARDYKEFLGEMLPWRTLGFKNLYELLISIPDVAKLEFRQEDEDNRVFAVLDRNSYSSLHAKRMSVKGFGRGTKALSPEEIEQWKRNKLHGGSNSTSSAGGLRTNNTKNTCGLGAVSNNIPNGPSQNIVTNHQIPCNSITPQLTVNLNQTGPNKIVAESKGSLKITIRNTDATPASVVEQSKYKDFVPNLEGIYSLFIKLEYRNNVAHLDKNQAEIMLRGHMALPGCTIFQVNVLSDQRAFVRYRTKREVIAVFEAKNNIEVGGIRLLITAAKEKGSGSSSNKQNNHPALMQTPVMAGPVIVPVGRDFMIQSVSPAGVMPFARENFVLSGKPGILPTPGLGFIPNVEAKPTGFIPNAETKPAQTVPSKLGQEIENAVNEIQNMTDPILQTGAVEAPAQLPEKTAQEVRDEILQPSQLRNRQQGFVLGYGQMKDMFHKSCQQLPRTATDFPDRIKLIVTFTMDACRFWIQLSEQQESCEKMMERLQLEMSKVDGMQSPFPSIHHFGAARYSDDHWYRCWVLRSNKEKDEIEVFYCDYGNHEIIKSHDFRHVHKNFLIMPPQAIPVKLHGTTLPNDLDDAGLKNGAGYVNYLCMGKIIEADVIKKSTKSEPHIIELANVTHDSLTSGSLEDALVQGGYLKKTEVSAKEVSNGHVATKEHNAGNNTIQQTTTTVPRQIQDGPKAPNNVNRVANDSSKPDLETNTTANHAESKGDLLKKECLLSVAEMENLGSCPSLFPFSPLDILRVEVLAVESPSFFYLKTHDSDQLLVEVKELLSSCVMEENAEPTVGNTVCLKEESGNRRVRIIDLAANFMYSKKVLVANIDSGQKIWANVNQLYELSPELKRLSEVATCAALAGIEPKNRVTSITSILSSLVNKESFVHIIGEDSAGKFFVELFKDCRSESINLAAVHNRLAKVVTTGHFAVPTKKQTAQKPNPGVRKASSSSTGTMSPAHSTSNLSQNKETARGMKSPNNKNQNQNSGEGNQGPQANGRPFGKTARQRLNSNSSNQGEKPNFGGRTISISSDSSVSDERSGVKSRPKAAPSIHEKFGDTNVVFNGSGHSGNYNSHSGNFSDEAPSPHGMPIWSDQSPTEFKTIPIKSQLTNGSSPSRNSASEKPRFRPHTPPLPGASVQQDNTVDIAGRELLASILANAEDHNLGDIIPFTPDGSLCRESIDFQIKQWESAKTRLHSNIDSLNEALGTQQGYTPMKSRKKRLELLMRKITSETELAQVTEELKSLEQTKLSTGPR